MPGRILIVDDDAAMCELVEMRLAHLGHEAASRRSGAEALLALEKEDFAAVVADLNMAGMTGLALCERIVANRPDVPVIVITAFGSLDTAVAAIRAGAYDFITKPFEVEALALALDRAARHRALREEVKRLRRAVAETARFDDMLGASTPMRRLFDLVERAAASEASVLGTGESGTGKELVARALHARSGRRAGPFLAVNCAALPEALLESELFGHVRGAFTDARAARTGLFLAASGGTLFLDEIGDMPLALQPKLLRALQERRIRPLGGEQEVDVDVRIVAATNRDLEGAIEEGRFRRDLYFRVNVINLDVPPLRDRAGDVLLLAQHFVERVAARSAKPVKGLSAAAAQRLASYAWPGNVRELQNCIERAVALTAYEEVSVDDLPEKIRDYKSSHVLLSAETAAELVPLEEVERRYILGVLETLAGNKTRAAKVLGLDRRTLHRKLVRWRLAGEDDEA
ncbi:MAG TPA: sigma-54 dependent transcriptional regulator [Planctomycetota bacterium]|nr:sigma-54 dependent transcriptional regulator [Planctomycetota bacterium]